METRRESRERQRPQEGKVGEEMNGVWGGEAKVEVGEERKMRISFWKMKWVLGYFSVLCDIFGRERNLGGCQ